jgi:ABC-type lipoprotein export system ATPase subunit
VFQRFHLLPYLTVEENIRAASLALPGAGQEGRAEELMRLLRILERRRHLPGRLSVGEQQRTALARALYNRPSVLLADEPTGNLDAANTEIVLETFREFAAGGGTVLMVTHNEQAAARADGVWRLVEGRLVAER